MVEASGWLNPYELLHRAIRLADRVTMIRRTRKIGIRKRNRTSSQDLVDPVHCSAGASFTNTDCDDAIQECVRFRRGLEPRHCSKVVTRGIDDLSTAERGDHVRRA